MNKLLLFILFSGLCQVGCDDRRKPADLLITGRIYTLDDSQPVVEAVAVSGGRIIFAGTRDEAGQYTGEETEEIDLKDKVMTPGFIEGHAHIFGVGYDLLNLNLSKVTSYEDIIEQVKEAVSKAKPGEWIIGRGWHQDKWDKDPEKLIKGFPTHHLLSQASPDNPVFLTHASGHGGIANAKAMQIAGVNPLAKESIRTQMELEGGEVIKDELGNPTGIFNENAMVLIEKHIPDNNEERDFKALELAMEACLANGITSFQDAGEDRESIKTLYKFKREGKLKVRLYVMLENNRSLLNEWYKTGPDIDSLHWLTIRSIKIYSDGALGSRGAWLLSPYDDRTDTEGMATISMDTISKISTEALKYGFQLCSHAIGDRANHEILNRYEIAFNKNPSRATDHRFRIEHAQHLHPDDISRFGKLGVIPAMQAIHMASDRPWAINRLGKKRIIEGAYMWQSLLKTGARIVNGTDAPVEPMNPIACFYASVTRKTLAGEPEGGYEANEAMTREQALKSYTLDAAYGEFAENIKGSILQGKLADFTIFSQDIMKVPESELLATKVMMTIVGGKIVYLRK